jgi:hypothetical protein
MNVRRWNLLVWLVLLAAGAITSACRRTYVVVPRPSGGFRSIDTLRATRDGNDYRVTFRFDTVTHTRTLYVTDTLWREGTRIIRDTVRVTRRDTVRVVRRDTVRVARVDTVRLFVGSGRVDTVRVAVRDTVVVSRNVLRVDTLRRVDTVRVSQQTGTMVRVDTVRVRHVDTLRVLRTDTVRRQDTIRVVRADTVYISRLDRSRGVDTVRVVRADTIRVVRVDTVRVTRTDTVRVASGATPGPGRRMLFVPPGHYPPSGQCRVWIHDKPPGQQKDPAPCDALGDIPAGAFILFGGEAWDFDYDWVSAGGAPSQIVALKRQRRP